MRKLSIPLLFMTVMSLLCGCVYFDDSNYSNYGNYSVTSDPHRNSEYIGSDEELYNAIYEHLSAFKTEMSFYGAVDSDKIFNTYKRVANDHAELFWTGSSSVATSGNSDVHDFSVSPSDINISMDEVKTMCGKISDAADSIIDDIPEGASDWEKILFVHDSIIRKTWYQSDDTDDFTNSVYGCLVRGQSQSTGYSEAFKYIMNLLGFECGIVSNDSRKWNYIKLDGKYYWVDLTWDDPSYENDDGVTNFTHYYFMSDDEHFGIDHNLQKGNNFFVPECDSYDRYFYIEDGSYLNSFDPVRVADVISRHYKEKKAEIMFEDDPAYQMAVKLMGEGVGSAELYGALPEGWGISYGRDDEKMIISLFFSPGEQQESTAE